MPTRIRTRLLESLLDSIGDAVLGIDREGRVTLLNKKAEDLLGKSEGSVLGKTVWEVVPEGEFARAIWNQVREGEPQTREQIFTLPGEKVVLVQMRLIRHEDKKISGAIGIIKDLTDLRKFETAVGEFLGLLSQQLKSPLTAIKAGIETLLEGVYEDKETCKQFLKMLNEETNRLARIVVNIMDLSMAGKKETVKKEPLNLKEVVDQVLLSLSPLAKEKGIEVQVNVPDGLPLVHGDREKLGLLLVNLLDNAVKFTSLKGKGTITIEAEEWEKGPKISIADTGVGVPEGEQEKIFERFYRIDASPHGEVGGTGLGLAVAREIAEAHGWKITLSSQEGKGSTFTVWLQ